MRNERGDLELGKVALGHMNYPLVKGMMYFKIM